MYTIVIISHLSVLFLTLCRISLLFLHSLKVYRHRKMADNVHFLGKEINGFCPVLAMLHVMQSLLSRIVDPMANKIVFGEKKWPDPT